MEIKLTQYSHGAGCGCKIAPSVLEQMLQVAGKQAPDARLLVGNSTKDDAAVYDLGNGTALVTTTDFFMPIVDDPHDFGRIASVNAISDVYAMGGKPVVAIAILGWPIDKLSADVAGKVLEGARAACTEAGITLGGGHSIDSPEPIFGLAVTGLVDVAHIKRNSGAQPGDLLYLTKPIGVGILSTAMKKGMLENEHADWAPAQMKRLNTIGEILGRVEGVHAMTDVTGFGLLGHLTEMCEGSGVSAAVRPKDVPYIDEGVLRDYVAKGAVPGGTKRNHASYGHHIEGLLAEDLPLLCDPQTSGGLLISVDPAARERIETLLQNQGWESNTFGEITAQGSRFVHIRHIS